MEVRRSTLREAMSRYTTEQRTQEIMKILEPLFCMCERDQFLYGFNPELPQGIQTHIAFLTNRPCVGVEGVAESGIPKHLVTSQHNSNFISRTRVRLYQRLRNSVDPMKNINLTFDLRLSFGNRFRNDLPINLWNQLWESIRFWLLCEIGGKEFKKEAHALEHIVRLCTGGAIVFDEKPTETTVMLVVKAKMTSGTERYRLRPTKRP